MVMMMTLTYTLLNLHEKLILPGIVRLSRSGTRILGRAYIYLPHQFHPFARQKVDGETRYDMATRLTARCMSILATSQQSREDRIPSLINHRSQA